jgi:molybdopterin molybdotransferase
VAIVSTGDELVPVDQTPGPAEIRNSNSFTLSAQVSEAGGDPAMLGIAGDEAGDLGEKLDGALAYDIVLTSGGVSMGKYDLVEGIFADRGVEVAFEKVAMKPGKPTVFGWRDRTFVFGLPGNPVSTIVSFQLFVRPLIRRLLHARNAGNTLLEAVLSAEARCDPAREACIPASVSFRDGRYHLATVPWKGSSDLIGLSRANAYVLIPRREGVLAEGARVRFIPVSGVDWPGASVVAGGSV